MRVTHQINFRKLIQSKKLFMLASLLFWGMVSSSGMAWAAGKGGRSRATKPISEIERKIQQLDVTIRAAQRKMDDYDREETRIKGLIGRNNAIIDRYESSAYQNDKQKVQLARKNIDSLKRINLANLDMDRALQKIAISTAQSEKEQLLAKKQREDADAAVAQRRKTEGVKPSDLSIDTATARAMQDVGPGPGGISASVFFAPAQYGIGANFGGFVDSCKSRNRRWCTFTAELSPFYNVEKGGAAIPAKLGMGVVVPVHKTESGYLMELVPAVKAGYMASFGLNKNSPGSVLHQGFAGVGAELRLWVKDDLALTAGVDLGGTFPAGDLTTFHMGINLGVKYRFHQYR